MLRFTKSIKIKKLFYLMNSILITICTLFAESKIAYLYVLLLLLFVLLLMSFYCFCF